MHGENAAVYGGLKCVDEELEERRGIEMESFMKRRKSIGAVFWHQKCISDWIPWLNVYDGTAVVIVCCFGGSSKGVGWVLHVGLVGIGCHARTLREDSPQVELVFLFGITVALAVLVEVVLVKYLATVTGVEDLFCDARSGSEYLVVCVWEGCHHLALLLYDFCIVDTVG